MRFRSHRPSRALRDEPATHCLLTLAALAHPHWKLPPSEADVVRALMQAIDGLDLVRAQLLARIVYRIRDGQPVLSSFEQIGADAQDRLTYSLGEQYEELRHWLDGYQSRGVWAELDHFFSLLFGEVLSQSDFGFHSNLDAAAQAANLIESVRKFRQVVQIDDLPAGRSLGQEYVAMVQQGVVAAQYVRSWDIPDEEAVLLAPAYTFLMYNRPGRLPVLAQRRQLRAGGSASTSRSRTRSCLVAIGRPTACGPMQTSSAPGRLPCAAWLSACCVAAAGGVYLGYQHLSEQGYEEGGPLLQAFNRLLRRLQHLERSAAQATSTVDGGNA